MRACKQRTSRMSSERHASLVAAEGERYLAKLAGVQTCNGTGAALHVLWLPKVVGEPLPPYSNTPEHISPAHCRLCMAEFPVVVGEADHCVASSGACKASACRSGSDEGRSCETMAPWAPSVGGGPGI